jgi:hypothetical protein
MSQLEAEELRYLWSEYNRERARIARVTWTNGKPLEEGPLHVAIAAERRAGNAIERIRKICGSTR